MCSSRFQHVFITFSLAVDEFAALLATIPLFVGDDRVRRHDDHHASSQAIHTFRRLTGLSFLTDLLVMTDLRTSA